MDQNLQPKVSVAIQGYKNLEMLRMCLQAVHKHTQGLSCEVIVADSATENDKVMMMREEFPDFVFLPHKKNVGFGAMVNACLDVAVGEYVFIVNPDTLLESETVPQLTAFMDENPSIGLCGPAQKNFNNKLEVTRFAFYRPQTILYRRTFLKKFSFAKKHLDRFEIAHQTSVEPYPVPWVLGSAMFARRKTIQEVGGMDRRFFMYMEDVDWCRRFWEAGYKVYYHPGITLFHFYGKGSAQGNFFQNVLFNRLTWIHIASAWKYFRKYAFQKDPEIYS